jgi:glycogen debranching enzyme
VEIAPRLVATMMGPELWSGWGLRTLGSAEARYNPVSYHNGSVWPHDTAIFAWGLHRYGFHAELATVCDALFDAAGEMPDRRMPELFAGVGREQGMPPTAYTHACYPQAWAAAALPLLAWLSPG